MWKKPIRRSCGDWRHPKTDSSVFLMIRWFFAAAMTVLVTLLAEEGRPAYENRYGKQRLDYSRASDRVSNKKEKATGADHVIEPLLRLHDNQVMVYDFNCPI